jgi:hypothetical protein
MRFLLLALLLLIPACTLSQTGSSTPGVEILATTAPPNSAALVANCDPSNSGWFLYTAAVGETIESVVQQVGSPLEMVMTANCWTTVPQVTAGSQWYMPPASIDPIINLDNVPVGGRLSVTPSSDGIGGTISILETPVTVTMLDYPANAQTVFFYMRVNGEVIGINTDANLSDGASVSWEPIQGVTYEYAAVAAVAYDATSTPILHTLEFGFNTA